MEFSDSESSEKNNSENINLLKKAYSDKKDGAEFIEYLRKRIILAHSILADDGSIFVHLDWKMAHYIDIIV